MRKSLRSLGIRGWRETKEQRREIPWRRVDISRLLHARGIAQSRIESGHIALMTCLQAEDEPARLHLECTTAEPRRSLHREKSPVGRRAVALPS